MTPKTKLPEVDPIYLLTKLVELETKMLPLADAVQRLEDANEGTLRTKGMKEKVATAQQDIEANKQAFIKLESNLKEFVISMQATLREAFIEITKKFDEKTAQILTETQSNKTALTKIQPWINVISWVVLTAGGIILGLLLSGKWKIITP